MAVVYKAYDTHLEQDVAVKVIRTDHLGPAVLDRALKRFEREAKSVAKLNHSNIVSVIDYGEQEGSPYLVMPYLPGGTLKQYLKINGKLSWQKSIQLLLPIAEALGYAHQHNLVHRDVKPANILLTANGEPMLTDFGVAKVLDEEVTQDLTGTAATVGTPEYMAPEQIMSKTVDHRADIYALGVVFFEMVTGRRPYEADTPMAVLVKHASAPLPRPGDLVLDLPYGVEKVLIKTLQKKPEDRYQSMSEFAEALRALLSTGTVTTPPPIQIEEPKAKPQQPIRSTSWLKLIMFGVTGVVLITAIVVGLTSGFLSGRLTQKTDTDPGKLIETATIFLPTLTQLPTTPAEYMSTITITPTFIETEIAQNNDTLMVYVPEGAFLMGSVENDDDSDADERPQHTIVLEAFYIDLTEVTNAMFAAFVAETNYRTDAEKTGKSYALVGSEWLEVSGADWQHPFGPSSNIDGLADHPVIHVSWNDATAYCHWARKRLPTEAEWEKAARGTGGAIYPWGNSPPAGNLVNYADINTNFEWSVKSVNDGYKYTSPVGSYPNGASPYGALDMAGNVWEWVADWYGKDYYLQSPEHNPTGPASGTIRVMRGGAWDDLIKGIRSSYRAAYAQANTNGDTGFRCASSNEVVP